jgi:hypothetical protein
VRPVGHVNLVRAGGESVPGKFRCRFLDEVTAAVEQGDRHAVRRQPAGDATSDARRGAGDDGDTEGAHRAASAGVNSMYNLWRPRRTQVGS